MFTPKVMSLIGYALLALIIYLIADRYIISPDLHARREAEAVDLAARRNAEAFAAAARAEGATHAEVQRQARIGYNLSHSLNAPSVVVAPPPPRATEPVAARLVSRRPSRAEVDASDKTAELRACKEEMSMKIESLERAGKVVDGAGALAECARIINLVGRDRVSAIPRAVANATQGTLGHFLFGK